MCTSPQTKDRDECLKNEGAANSAVDFQWDRSYAALRGGVFSVLSHYDFGSSEGGLGRVDATCVIEFCRLYL